jgi:oxalate decarboxylase
MTIENDLVSKRRGFLAGLTGFMGAGFLAWVSSQNKARAGDTSFMNNVPDPLTSGKELPTFKFQLEKQKGKVIGGSSVKAATVRDFPISKSIAGASMRLEPGGMRELHWHATAAEWTYVVEGRIRTTVIEPGGTSEVNEFSAGDVWFFPRGHGHMLECLGDQPCHFILIFDNGYFSEFGTFSLTDWFAQTPKALLAKNLRVPAETFASFPKGEVYFSKGKIPPEKASPALLKGKTSLMSHKATLKGPQPHRVFPGGKEWTVDSSKFPIAKTVAGVLFELEAGALRELHWHPNADEWQYVLEGTFRVTLFGSGGRYREEVLEKGDVAYLPQGFGHSIENIGDKTGQILLGLNTEEYQVIDISSWLASNSPEVLATNFNQPKEIFENFPRKDVFIAPL